MLPLLPYILLPASFIIDFAALSFMFIVDIIAFTPLYKGRLFYTDWLINNANWPFLSKLTVEEYPKSFAQLSGDYYPLALPALVPPAIWLLGLGIIGLATESSPSISLAVNKQKVQVVPLVIPRGVAFYVQY